MAEAESSNKLPGLRNPQQYEEFDCNNIDREDPMKGIKEDLGKDKDDNSNQIEDVSQNPEKKDEKGSSKKKEIIFMVIVAIIILGVALGITFGVVRYTADTISTEKVEQYEILNTNETIHVYTWTYRKKHIISHDENEKGHIVKIHSKSTLGRLLQNRNLQDSKDDGNHFGYFYQSDEEAGVTTKILNEENVMVEIDPYQNLVYFEKNHPEEAQKIREEGRSRRLQQLEGQPDIEPDFEGYMNEFHKMFAKTTGRSQKNTKVTHAPSYVGHKINGEYKMEREKIQNSRLLFQFLQGFSTEEKVKLYQKIIQIILKPLLEKHINNYQKFGQLIANTLDITLKQAYQLYIYYQMSKSLGYRLLSEEGVEESTTAGDSATTQEGKEAEEKQCKEHHPSDPKLCVKKALVRNSCHKKERLYISLRTWQTIERCTTTENAGMKCTINEWHEKDTPFKRSQEEVDEEKEYKVHHRHIAHNKHCQKKGEES